MLYREDRYRANYPAIYFSYAGKGCGGGRTQERVVGEAILQNPEAQTVEICSSCHVTTRSLWGCYNLLKQNKQTTNIKTTHVKLR